MQAADMTPLELDGALWSFALEFYARPGVAEACLLLQDRLAADVCLVLFALFIARQHGILVEVCELERLDRAVTAWRTEVVWPLRALRRRLKTGPDPAPSTASESLRRRIKAAELGAEQIELAALARSYGAHAPAAGVPLSGVPLSGVPLAGVPLAANTVVEELAAFLAARGGGSTTACNTPEVRAALDVLAAAWPGASGGR